MSWYAPDKHHDWVDLGPVAGRSLPDYQVTTFPEVEGAIRPENATGAIIRAYAGHYWLRWVMGEETSNELD